MPAPGPGKKLCGAQRPNQPEGVTCKRVAGHGTDHLGEGRCSRHGGSTPNHKTAAEIELARKACVSFGVPIDTGPKEALLAELCETKGVVAWYRALVEQLPTHPGTAEVVGGENDGATEIVNGVYAPTYHQSGLPTGEAKPHILVTLWMEERKHLTVVAKAAHAAGIDERRVQIEEEKLDLFVAGMTEFAKQLGRDPSDPEVRKAGRAALTLIAGGKAA